VHQDGGDEQHPGQPGTERRLDQPDVDRPIPLNSRAANRL
jgi:hypothetical protein